MSRLRFLSLWLLFLFLPACVSLIPFPPKVTPPVNERATATATQRPLATGTGAPSASAGTLNAYYLDVGQGDSILLAGPDFTILIDTGRQDHNEVVPDLKLIGIQSIDLLIGTHPHADHIGQFPEVLGAFPVREVWMSGDTNTTKTFEDAIDAVTASGAGYHEPRAGEIYQIGSARIEVLNPEHLTGEPNEGSVSIRLIFGQMAFMFTGDAEAPTERAIIASGRDLQAQILKAGHHGSNTSSSLAFLLAVKPEVAIWSAGKDNTYGHPSPETLARFKQLGIATYGTAVDGTIVVSTDGMNYQIRSYPAGATLPARPPLSDAVVLTPVADSPGCAAGQVNINTATAEELQKTVHIGAARARQIIQLRPFASVDDMVRIGGISQATVTKIKQQGLACVE
jgi:competence ComEA-like helix-hairpin-helix protein